MRQLLPGGGQLTRAVWGCRGARHSPSQEPGLVGSSLPARGPKVAVRLEAEAVAELSAAVSGETLCPRMFL